MSALLILVVAYLIGSVSFALIIGRRTKGIDIRNNGSGNLGATNAFRVLGAKAGSLVLIGDVLKGTFAASLPVLLSAPIDPVWTGVAAVVGHCYPIYTKFKGGKAVATSGGVMLFVDPTMFVVTIAFCVLMLILFKMVSLASVTGSMFAVTYVYFTGSEIMLFAMTLLMVFIVYRHRSNLLRMMNKTEPKVDILKRKIIQQ